MRASIIARQLYCRELARPTRSGCTSPSDSQWRNVDDRTPRAWVSSVIVMVSWALSKTSPISAWILSRPSRACRTATRSRAMSACKSSMIDAASLSDPASRVGMSFRARTGPAAIASPRYAMRASTCSTPCCLYPLLDRYAFGITPNLSRSRTCCVEYPARFPTSTVFRTSLLILTPCLSGTFGAKST